MQPDETPDAPPTEGQTIPPEEQIIPTAGLVQEDEQVHDESTQGDQGGQSGGMGQQAQSLARANPMPIGLAVAFVAGVVFGRIASRR
jgi:hypothetical protein